MKLNYYTFNNYEKEDIYLCDKHNRMPYGMWCCTIIDSDPENDIMCQECGDSESDNYMKIPSGLEWER